MSLRLGALLYFPKLILKTLLRPIDKNPLHDGVRNLTGKKFAACSKDISFCDVKDTAK